MLALADEFTQSDRLVHISADLADSLAADEALLPEQSAFVAERRPREPIAAN